MPKIIQPFYQGVDLLLCSTGYIETLFALSDKVTSNIIPQRFNEIDEWHLRTRKAKELDIHIRSKKRCNRIPRMVKELEDLQKLHILADLQQSILKCYEMEKRKFIAG